MIAAVLVNHNTSAYAELAIRSLFVENPGLDLRLTVFDNASTDDRSGMLVAAAHDVPVVLSGRVMRTHGQYHVIADAMIMHAFAVSYPDASSPLLVDKEARRDHWLAIMRLTKVGLLG